ncbi:MAG: hypothetical protein NZ455_14565 [Bacteroidia bacterium]|nr:hypothetical protein [Bacteroidia bacterium]
MPRHMTLYRSVLPEDIPHSPRASYISTLICTSTFVLPCLRLIIKYLQGLGL